MKPYRPPRPPRRVLVVCLRRIGDVLTVTPLLRSLRQAWPGARIDVLVPRGTAGVLEGNPDIDTVLLEPGRGTVERLRFLRRLWRRYDLSVGTQHNDRPWLYTLAAAARRVLMVPPLALPGARLKRALSHGWCEIAMGRDHAVETYLRLADVLGLPRMAEVVPPVADSDAALRALLGDQWMHRPLAVIHPSPMYRYKAWSTDGWIAAASHLVSAHGLDVVVTGGPAPDDRTLAESIRQGMAADLRDRVIPAAGRLSLAELALLLGRAALYLGPDTSVTHLAAACGTRTLALFGPSHPVAWGPWPRPGTPDGRSPWVMKAPLQRSDRVWLIQGEGECVPCLAEGCDRHLNSHSACLDQLSPERVKRVIDQALMDLEGA